MATNQLDLFSYLPGLEVQENEILEAELAAQQILKAAFPTMDLREGTALRDLSIRPNATLLSLINKALVFYFQNNSLSDVDNSTPQVFVDKLMSNWFLTRKTGIKAVINARLYFAKEKNINLYSDTFFSPDGTLKYFPTASLTFAGSQLVFESASNQYYLDVDLMAENSGVDYNITTGSLLYFSNFDPYFLHAEINYLRETAEDVETNTEFVSRATSAISTRNNINVPSINANLTDYFSALNEVMPIGFGDPEMVRDQILVVVPGVTDPVWIHHGGMVDVYSRTPVASSVVQLTTTGSGQINVTGAVYKIERSLISGGDNDDTLPLYVTKSVSSITRSGTTATVTCTGHGYTNGQSITIQGAVPSGYNGTFVITYIGVNSFSYQVVNTLTTPATGTITAGVPTPFTVTNSNTVTVTPASITRSGAVVTVTYANHGLLQGERVTIAGCNQTDYNGNQVIASVVDRNTFTYTIATTPVTPATGTITLTYVNRYYDVGFSDRQSLTVDFGGSYPAQTASFTVYYHQNIDGIQGYLTDASRRVLCGDLLARGFNLTMLDLTITGYNGPTPDAELCNTVAINYLATIRPGEPFLMSDLLALLYEKGITSIKTPVGITYTKYWNDLLGVTTGSITDVLDPNDSRNVFMVNSIITLNEVIT
jgi:hypothetical protein